MHSACTKIFFDTLAGLCLGLSTLEYSILFENYFGLRGKFKLKNLVFISFKFYRTNCISLCIFLLSPLASVHDFMLYVSWVNFDPSGLLGMSSHNSKRKTAGELIFLQCTLLNNLGKVTKNQRISWKWNGAVMNETPPWVTNDPFGASSVKKPKGRP